MAEILLPKQIPRAAIVLWIGHWGTPPDVIRRHIADVPNQDHIFGTWLARPRGGTGWRPIEVAVPADADPLAVALQASKDMLGMVPEAASAIGIVTSNDLPGAVTTPTILYSFATKKLPRPAPGVELGFFPLAPMPEADLHPRFQHWLGPLMVTAFGD